MEIIYVTKLHNCYMYINHLHVYLYRKFAIVHDSQILQSIPNEELYSHAYIHYMTLNDISARGYVRQFCMSFISRKERYVSILLYILYIFDYIGN